LLYLLRVELPPERVQIAATLAELGSPTRPDVHLLLCADDGRLDALSLRVADAPAESRALDVSGLPVNARTRALALALAEIIGSTALAATAAPAPAAGAQGEAGAPPTAGPGPTTSPVAQANEQPVDPSSIEPPPTVVRVGAAFASRAVALPDALGTPTWLLGPALGLDVSRWHFAAVLLLGQDDVQFGTIAVTSATGAVAYDVWRSGGVVAFAARVRGELGMTWATGEPRAGARARSASALAAAALVELAVLARLAGPWSLDVRIGTGYARGLGALASGSREATTHGLVLGASAGLSFELP
jgi:hypothetical protein